MLALWEDGTMMTIQMMHFFLLSKLLAASWIEVSIAKPEFPASMAECGSI